MEALTKSGVILTTGPTNIIAIDGMKKNEFYKKYSENKPQIKQEPVPIQPIIQQEPVDFGIPTPQVEVPNKNVNIGQEVQPQNINAGDSLTNADLLSQSFSTTSNELSTSIEPKESQQVSFDLTGIVYDMMNVQDEIDKLIAKILNMIPDKEVIQSIEPQIDNLLSAQEEINVQPIASPNIMQDATIQNNIIQEEPAQNVVQEVQIQNDINSFMQSSTNIFDEPQSPSLQ